ncbi:ABC transporter substrate-binding protein [Paracoccus panacisoli]|uniref:ABC transporter permease n=2 Tax=Paracoccus TaxID=265 RepID=A0A099G8W1_9RHOB|nr:ABC transporter substrate-binding protein [Paracoccus sanguinis]KGJ19295.1 ABC transporter permease [Paracoccus sanguinis]KGJ22712.1 ABC transporter permease [Paracoccus sanguinis]SDW34740.1 amino acid/amide ABC transporter substrate-binding protein, HAAT family [Paracoccus sanguinis]
MKNICITAALAVLAAGTASAEISDGRVKIGIMNDQSGPYSALAGLGSVEAARMAVEDFGGTVLDAPIEIVSADHQNKADVGSTIARRWYDTEQVDSIMDLTTSSVALAVQALSADAKKITIATGVGSTDLSGKACTPYGFHWTFDNRSMSVGTANAVVDAGGDSWYFLTADYAFGHSLEATATKVIEAKGGKVLGSARHPLNTSDYSAFLLQAQSSGAKVIGLASAGMDSQNAIKQAAEFGLTKGGQKLAGLLMMITDVHGLGLEAAQGLYMTEAFYWDRDDASRAFSERYKARTGAMPTMIQAGTYSAVLAYLKAVAAAGTDESDAVAAKLHEQPLDDFFAPGARVAANGQLINDVYLMQVKTPEESKGDWDYYKIIATIPGAQAYLPAAESGCPLVK